MRLRLALQTAILVLALAGAARAEGEHAAARGSVQAKLIPAPEQDESAYLFSGEYGGVRSCFRVLRCDSLLTI